MKDSILLIVDVQEGLMDDHPTNEDIFIKNVKELIKLWRNQNKQIIFVRHQDKDDLIPDSKRWQIYHELSIHSDDKIIDKKFNSAFLQTDLDSYLQSKQIKNIVLVGMQTEFCVDATCKSAFEHGYQVFIPKDTVTTFDNIYMSGEQTNTYYYEKIWNGRFGKVCTIAEIEDIL